VLRGIRVAFDDLRDRRFIDTVKTLVPFTQLAVAPVPAPQHLQNDGMLA